MPKTKLETNGRTTPAAPRINIGATWSSPHGTRLVTELWPARGGQEAALQYREDGAHRTITLTAFRGWIWKHGAVKVENTQA